MPSSPRKSRFLTLEERQEIERLLKEGVFGNVIARRLGRHGTAINKEIANNGGRFNYSAQKAHERRHKVLKEVATKAIPHSLARMIHLEERIRVVETVLQTVVELLKEKSRE